MPAQFEQPDLDFAVNFLYTDEMDTDQLIAHARARFDHAAARKVMQERYQAKMLFAHAGGMWRAGPELLSLLSCCVEAEVVVLDLYHTPVKVNAQELLDLARERWQEQMNCWLIEHQNIAAKR